MGEGGYANQRQNYNFKEIKVKVLKHFLIPNLRLGTCLVEPWVATPPPPPLVAVEVEVVGPYLGLTILINK